MSQTRTPRGRPSSSIAEITPVAITDLHPNSWNVNRLNAFQYAKLVESIQTYGFWDPILARKCVLHGDYEIIGGEHRWRAATQLNYAVLPVVVREMDDTIARKISLIDNELHGQADPVSLGSLLREIMEQEGPVDVLRGLPFTDDILRSLTGFTPLPPVPTAQPPSGSPPPQTGEAVAEKWVERTYRMPASVAQVLDDALEKVKMNELGSSGQAIETFQALEVLAAEYLAS